MANRLALVVGVAAYPSSPLNNPVNDAQDIARVLAGFDFDVIVRTDCDFDDFDQALNEFESRLDQYEAGLFFFAGHGLQIDGTNYLVVTNSDNANKRSAKRTSINLDDVLTIMNESGAAVSIVILDACRTDPWQRSWNRDLEDRGLAPVFAPKGTIIGYATSPGEVALDGIGRNGTYTAALLGRISEKDRPIEVIFKKVRNDVAAATQGAQTTWEHTSLSGEFYFDVSVASAAGGYSPQACADSTFQALSGSLAATTIRALKSRNWYTQNPAVDALSGQSVEAMTLDELFVIGRNILQAANGNAGSAASFIEHAPERMRAWPDAKRKAVYDGILFEIFFDSEGALRNEIKGRCFDDVFANRDVMATSFDFITDCLNQSGRRMFVPPNQNRELAVTISIDNSTETDVISGLWIGGQDVMVIDDARNHWPGLGSHSSMHAEHVKSHLSSLLAIPQRQLEISFRPTLRGSQVSYPLGMSV
jgi:Caspase domain